MLALMLMATLLEVSLLKRSCFSVGIVFIIVVYIFFLNFYTHH